MGTIANQIKSEKQRFDLIKKCADLYADDMNKQSNTYYIGSDFRFLFEGKTTTQLKKHLSCAERLKKLTQPPNQR